MPVGRPATVAQIKNNFLSDITSAESLVDVVSGLHGINPTAAKPLHSKHAHRIVELAFMGVIASWEEFLEAAFVRYLVGAKSASNYTPTPKVGKANTIPHAYIIISGNAKFNASNDYSKFIDDKWVTSKADFFFDGGKPFDCLKAKHERLQDAVLIRNRVAHRSEKCRSDFKKVAVKLLALTGGNLSQGQTAGHLLLSTATTNFGLAASNQNMNYFRAYMALYKELADKIVP